MTTSSQATQPTTETNIQNALYELWGDYYTSDITQEERNAITQEFTDKWLFDMEATRQIVKHPATAKKGVRVTVGEVIADFIMRVLSETEKTKEYPVLNADKTTRRKQRRKEAERALIEGDKDTEYQRRPAYSVYESEIKQVTQKPPETSVKEFVRLLEYVKANPKGYAARQAKGRAETETEIVRRIGKLDIGRIRECAVCGGAFFAFDLRRRTCDIQGRADKKYSTCDSAYRNAAKSDRNSVFKGTERHYKVEGRAN